MGLGSWLDIKGTKAKRISYLAARTLNQAQLSISDLLQEDFYLTREDIENRYDEIKTSVENVIQLKKNPLYTKYAYNELLERLARTDSCLYVFIIRLAKGNSYVDALLINVDRKRIEQEASEITTDLENPERKTVLSHKRDAYQMIITLNESIDKTLLGKYANIFL